MSPDQIAILLFGVGAVFLSQSLNPRVSRWACLLGLCSQPFWFYAAYTAGQWGILLSSGLYTFGWARGVWGYWVLPRRMRRLQERRRMTLIPDDLS